VFEGLNLQISWMELET